MQIFCAASNYLLYLLLVCFLSNPYQIYCLWYMFVKKQILSAIYYFVFFFFKLSNVSVGISPKKSNIIQFYFSLPNPVYQTLNFSFTLKWWGEILIYCHVDQLPISIQSKYTLKLFSLPFDHLLTLSRSSFIFLSLPSSSCLLVSLHMLAIFFLSLWMNT